MELSELVQGYIERNGITMAELTEALGYRSRTSVHRILSGQADIAALETFVLRVKERIGIRKDQFQNLLDSVYETYRDSAYGAALEVMNFVQGKTQPDRPVRLQETDTGRWSVFAERYLGVSQLSITLLNSAYVPIYHELRRLITQQGARVEHFIGGTEDALHGIHIVTELMNLIPLENYNGYVLREPGGRQKLVRGIRQSDCLFVRGVRGGDDVEEAIIFLDEERGVVLNLKGKMILDTLNEFERRQYRRIRMIWNGGEVIRDYLAYSRWLLALETKRNVYRIKPDFCMEWYPADIVMRALREGGFLDGKPEEAVKEAERIFDERVQNAYSGPQVTCSICKRSAVRRFAETGRASDHFWGMRPFTPDERVRIFETILASMRENPQFRLYFWQDGDVPRDVEIIHYAGEGILITQPNTSYRLDEDLNEVMVTHEGFCKAFQDFYDKIALKNHVIDRAEAEAFMQECIDVARACEA